VTRLSLTRRQGPPGESLPLPGRKVPLAYAKALVRPSMTVPCRKS